MTPQDAKERVAQNPPTEAVKEAVRKMYQSGFAPINPPIFGALVELGALEEGGINALYHEIFGE